MAHEPVRYSINLAVGLTGMRYDGGHAESFSYTNPTIAQVIAVTVGTGTAGGDWTLRINDLTEGQTSVVTFTGDASTTTTALNMANAWNAASNVFAHWSVASPAVAVATFAFPANNRRYQVIVTPAAGGAVTVVDTTGAQTIPEVGVAAFVDNTATDFAGSRLLIPGAAVADFRGVIERTDHLVQEGAPTSTFDFYAPGKAVPVVRQGRMWVHVGTAVNVDDAVGVDLTGTANRLGTFGDAAATDYTALTAGTARYLRAAAANELTVLEVYGIR